MAYIAPYALAGVGSPTIPGDIQAGDVTTEAKPPFIPAPACAKVEVRFTVDGQPAENVFYLYKGGAAYTYTDLVALSLTVATLWSTWIVPIWNTATALVQVRCSDAGNRYGPVAELAVEPNVPGTASGDGANTDDCIGISFHTGLKGRSQNGRLFVAGTLVSEFGASVPLDGPRLARLNALGGFFDALRTDTHALVLVSFQHLKLWRTTAQVTTVSELTVGQFIYTMRRRLPGHNRHR